jgi:Ca-activated chloride channel family protein
VLEHNLRATASLTEGGPAYEGEPDDLQWAIFRIEGGAVATNDTANSYRSAWEVQAPPGDYLLRAKVGAVVHEERVTLTADALAEVHVVLNAGVLRLTGRRTEGGEADGEIYVEASQGEAQAYGYGSVSSVMPAGEIVLKGRQAAAEVTRTVTLAPGEVLEADIVVGSGVAAVGALYAPGGPPVEGDEIFFEAFGAAEKADGSRESFAYRYGAGQLDLPAGDYVLFARLGEAAVTSAPFQVAAGGRAEVELVLNAGVVAVSAPGASRMNLFSEAKDIQGNRREVGYAFGEAYQATLPAGRYVVVTGYEDGRPDVETAFEVAAGGRVEVAVP